MWQRILHSSLKKQILLSALLVLLVSLGCYLAFDVLTYLIIGFILMVTVSIIAMLFDLIPTLLAAALSALIWDFFFMKPYYTFKVEHVEDVFLLVMYFVIVLINAVFTYKIKQIKRVAQEREQKLRTIELYNTLLDSLSHELKTPIATIMGAADSLQNNTDRLTEFHKESLVGEIGKAASRLYLQVENLLNMSRLESGVVQPRLKWCDVEELLYPLVQRIQKEATTHHIQVNIAPGLPLVKLDQGFIEQSMYNLLRNATIYTPEHTTIRVTAHCENGLLTLEVADEGAGFPEAEIDKVFDKFYRLKNSKTGGSGLGLSIVKGFVEAHGGTISLRNREQGGAVFTITIPVETTVLNTTEDE